MKKTLSVIMLVAAFVFGGQAQASAQTKPDFTGTWKLNLEKSDFGERGKPVSETDMFAQTGDAFKITVNSETTRGKRNYEFSLKADGTDTPFPASALSADSQFKIVSSKGEWQGGSLVITQKVTFGEYALTMKSTYTLSADGKTLTKASHTTSDNGEFDSKSVYDKA